MLGPTRSRARSDSGHGIVHHDTCRYAVRAGLGKFEDACGIQRGHAELVATHIGFIQRSGYEANTTKSCLPALGL